MATKKLMKWECVYEDDTIVKEDDLHFDQLDLDKVKLFSLEGLDTKITHNTETGDITINNNTLNFFLNDTRIGKSKDVINYKEKLKMVLGDTSLEKNIIGYYTGWKESNEYYKYIETLIWVDMMKQQVKVRLRVTPIKELKGNFDLIINGVTRKMELLFDNLDKRHEFVIEIFNHNK